MDIETKMLNGAAISSIPMFSRQSAFCLRLAKELARMGAHSSFQGGMSVAQGGKFIHGFVAGGLGSLSGSATAGAPAEIQLIMAAAVGGTAASISGGKFANGAITGAYVVLFNHLMHTGDDPSDRSANSSASRPDEDGLLTHGEADGWYKWGKGDPLYVDLDKLDFSTVNMSRFDNPEFFIDGHPGVHVRFDSQDYLNRDQALVYGTIGIVKIGKNTIMALPDTYDFDLKYKQGTFFRDAATVFGKTYAGYGTPFPIYFRGTTTLH